MSDRQKEVARLLFTKHGHASNGVTTPTYRSWKAMMQRCCNPACPSFARYGGRGIKVWDRWFDFTVFLADMGPRPEGTTLDRWPNNDGDYEPENCRWASRKEQQANRNIDHARESEARKRSWLKRKPNVI